MGRPSSCGTALLFVGALYREREYLLRAGEELRARYGDTLFESPELPWDYSDYYEEELGSPINRTFLFFREPVDPASLADIKLGTNALEEELSADGKRNINLDPGYLTPHNVVLASTKNYSHRIALGKGIFGEVTLVFRSGAYRSHLFTYADYASAASRELFVLARKSLLVRRGEKD